MNSVLFPEIFNKITFELSTLLGLPILDIDQEFEKLQIDYCLQADASKYEEIFKNYIKYDGTPNIPEFNIICQHILKSFTSVSAN